MNLDKTIKQYYFDNLTSLPHDKCFHFSSRIAAWLGEPLAYQALRDLQTYMVPNTPDGTLQLFKELLNKEQDGRRNAHELRQPYFQKYPKLWGAHLALFRARHLKFVYGINSSEQLFNVISRQELDSIANALLADDEATRILSTFAVNFLYLYKQIILDDKEFIKPLHFLEVSNAYDKNNIKHLQLMIYLFTHCIIGDSNFYTQAINPRHTSTYNQMLRTLEETISENFELINLDNKLEFLVCCRISNYKTDLFHEIHRECAGSLSNEGHFLIDSRNHNAQEDRKSFEKSEHRNVLFIMSNSAYEPHSTIIKTSVR